MTEPRRAFPARLVRGWRMGAFSALALVVFLAADGRAAGFDDAKQAMAAEEQGDLEQAVAGYGRAVNDAGLGGVSKGLLFAARGNALAAMGKLADALKDYDKALALAPDQAVIRFNRGNLLFGTGRYDEAIADYTRAIDLDAADAAAYNNRGSAWFAKGNLESALANYNMAVKLLPADAEFVNNRGRVWFAMGEETKARADFSQAKSLDPEVKTPLD
ncbi:tetratricopeptide repeat protein [Desulfolutivibrio sp.]|uniref:tetratricopeptide repeat protein n=1 Tax=Desulfolutivibrio sp. TaxID=2773296 RepID=UPI002F96A216